MTIPDFQSIMLPLLKFIGDGQEHNNHEIADALALQLGLTDEEREEMLPSGRQTRFGNRAAWAKAYLKMASLLESTGRGRCRITYRGLSVLKDDPPNINIKFLKQFPGYLEHRRGSTPAGDHDLEDSETSQTPIEVLETSYQDLRRELAQELLEQIMSCSPRFFENLVLDLLVAMGYGGSWKDAVQAVGRSGDGGIDGIIKEDKLGLDVVYIQAKRWEGTVGRPVVQAFAGSLMGQNARKGVLIITSQFSKDAEEYVTALPQTKIVLIDGYELAQLMIDHGIGVTKVASYDVKKTDLDYFGEE
ncbi:MAG: restriction endonuclease [Euryarchaeota archaeon]|nr:restriction endonuclease [Euryarchaeota archaeon]